MEAGRALSAHGPGGYTAVIQQLPVQARQGLCQFVQVAGAGKPVVHLRVDIDRVVTEPRREFFPVPKPLEVCRLGPGAGTGYQQVAAKVEQQRRQVGIRLSFFRIPDALVRVRAAVRALPKVQRDPVEIAPVFAYMPCQHGVKVFFKGGHITFCKGCLLQALGEGVAVEPGKAASDVEEDGHPSGLLYEKALLFGYTFSVRIHLPQAHVAHTALLRLIRKAQRPMSLGHGKAVPARALSPGQKAL